MKRIALSLGLLLFVVGCQDVGNSPTDLEAPSFFIQDGQTGGNPDFFWLPPMVGDPTNHPDFEVGEFNADLQPEIHICSIGMQEDPIGILPCVVGTTEVITFAPGPNGEAVTLQTDHYQYNWHTDEVPAGGVDPLQFYRIIAVVGTQELGFADFDVISSGKEMKNVNTGVSIALKDGRTLPVKFRIENGALCDPDAPDCASKTLNLAVGGTVALDDGDNVDIPPQEGSEVVTTITVTPCTDENGDPTNIPVDLPLFGECLVVTADPPLSEGGLTNAAIISFCTIDPLNLGLPMGQEGLVTVHRFDDPDLFALPHVADNCEEFLSSAALEQSGFMRFAKAGFGVVRDILGFPKPLQAARVAVRRLDTGRGGASPFFSQFQLGLPAKMVKVEGTDGQTAEVGTNVANPPAVMVTDLTGQPVQGATVTFEITSGGGMIGSMSIVDTSDAFGMASANFWEVGPMAGLNTADASGVGIAVIGNDGPRESFDPFTTSIPSLGMDDDQAHTDPVPVGEGVLEFSAFGIEGTTVPVIDGVISPGEWDDAVQFQTGSAGSISEATVYVLSDGTNLYLAVAVPDEAATEGDQVEFRFDNANNQTSDLNDDELRVMRFAGLTDSHLGVASWGIVDGQQDGMGAAGQSDGIAIYELSHPLNSGDVQDFALSVGDQVGFCVRYFDDNLSSGTGFPVGCILAANAQQLYQVFTIVP